ARPRRRVRLGQVDDGAADRAAHRHHRRLDRVRRQGGPIAHREGAARLPRRGAGGLPGPVLLAEPQAHGRADRHRAAGLPAAPDPRRRPRLHRGAHGARRPEPRPLGPVPRPVLGRSGAAHRHRTGARRLPEDDHRRRGGLGARRLGAGPGHQPAPPPAGRGGLQLSLHRPRPGRGTADRDAGGGDERGAHRRDRRPRPGLRGAPRRLHEEAARRGPADQTRVGRRAAPERGGPPGPRTEGDRTMIEYAMPGMWVRERTVSVPLNWWDPADGAIEVFVREVTDPDRRGEASLPLLTYLQGGPGGANPRPTEVSGWLEEALKHYRVVLVDQRGTGRSTPLDARAVAEIGDARAGADHLARFRADSIVRDLEHVRTTLYEGRKWATLAQSYGGWLTLAYLSHAPEALAASYVCGGIPGIPMNAEEVYRRTFDRVAAKTAEYYRRYPQDAAKVAAIADRLAAEPVLLPDGDRLTVRRFQTLGLDFGMKPGFERMHWLVEDAFVRDGRLSE